ncbi:hypothetical protein E5U26_14020, partial [Burkholderia pseudomallei]|nr:hypothetical protein [Burkholderia pseudomallei]
ARLRAGFFFVVRIVFVNAVRKAENTRIIFCDVLTHVRRYRVYHGDSTTVQAQKRWLWRS